MSRILRFFALVAVVLFSVNAFAGDPYGSCSVKKVYTDCAKGYVWQNGECVLESSGSCSAGQYWNGSECAGCPSTHPNSAAGASSESECFKTAELMKNGGSGTCFGKTGTYDGSITCYYGSTCALPSWNSSSCNMTNGSKIFKGWSSSDDATTGTTGDFVHGNTYYAVWVIPSCNITNGTGEVISALNNKPRCEVTCDSGYGTSGTYTGSAGGTNITFACTPTSNTCSAGQYWDGSACQECTSGYYCPGGTWTGTAVQGRNSCPDGYGNSEPGSVDESDCYLTTTAGKYVATPESAETTCAENGYCPGGIDVYYGDTDGRMACTANSSSDAGSDAISDCKCNAGYGGNAGVTNGTCTICSAGTYKTSSGNTSCSACTAGYYCTGGTNQTACTANSSSPAGSDEISDCQCNAGYGGNAGTTNGTCTICVAGTYKTRSGNGSCSTCTAGYYCTGGTNQTACTANSSSVGGADALSDCKCNAGYCGNAGVTGGSCTICAAGTYKTDSGNSSCSTCTEGYYCTGGTNNQTACPDGYENSAPGSVAESNCYMIVPAGSYMPAAGSTVPFKCPRGTSSGQHEVNYGNTSQCSSCAPGSYTPYDGATCAVCPAGYYCSGDGRATKCPALYTNSSEGSDAATDCYTNTLTGQYIATPRAEAVTDCQAGTSAGAHTVYYGETSQCNVCRTNQWSGDAAGSCQTCPSGWTNYGETAADHAYISSCKTTVGAGYWHDSVNSSFNMCADGTYSEEHMAGYGVSTSCEPCNTGYTNNSNHTACVAVTYTVQYNANGATSGSTASSSHTYGVAKTLTANGFTRTGYRFAGWATSASGDVVYANQQSVTNLASTQGATVNLYAKWTANTYTVSFDINGGTGVLPDPVTATYGSPMPTISTTPPTRTGYTFKGWYDGPTTGRPYYTAAGASAQNWDKTTNTTLYAFWKPNEYSIVLYPGSTTTGGTTTLYTTYGTNVYLDSSRSQAMTASTNPITKPTKDGYTFGGYYSESDGTGTEYINANGYITSDGLSAGKECTSCTWYVKWIPRCYQITLDNTANGGTGGTTTVLYKPHGSTLWYSDSSCSTQVTTITVPTKTNAVYNGHWSSRNYSGNQYIDDSGSLLSRTVTGPITLYAVYNCDTNWWGSGSAPSGTCTGTQSTVSFNAYGGTGGQTNNVTATYGSEMPEISTTPPTRTGYTFMGWYDAQTGGNQYYTAAGASARNWDKTADTRLYAQWTANTYTVKYNPNGGYGANASSSHEYGVSKTLTANGFARTGYTFAGWATSSSGDVVYTDQQSVINLASTQGAVVNLYAKWTVNNYKIVLDPGAENIASSYLYTTYGTNVYLDSNRSQAMTANANPITKPTRDGYTFGGYYSESGGTGTEYIDANGYITPVGFNFGKICASDSCTWYAGWTANTYTVKYNANGGSGTTASSSHEYGVAKALTANGFTRTGYTFAGWATSSSGDVVYANQQSVTNLASTQGATVNLYAKWTANTYRCSSGQYLNVTSCETCTAGYYCPSSSVTYTYDGSVQGRTPCGGNTKYSSSGATACSTVSSGYYSTGGTSTTRTGQTKCEAGNYCSGGVKTACGGGKYSSAGATSCSNITAGCYGTSASSSCPAVCAANTYSNAGASSCSSCPTDYKNSGDAAASHAGSASCIISVPGGKYVGTANSATLSTCAGGTYKAAHSVAYGSTSSCDTCEAGYYCPAGSDTQRLCADLGGGLYSESGEGSDATNDCYATVPATKYLSSTTSTSFTTCTAGYYCPGKTLYYASTGGRTACGGGKYSEAGSDASSDCKLISAGCYGASASSACPNTCAPGSYSTGGASGCTICGNKPTNSSYTDARGNTSADCPWTCNDGYNQTSDNQCGQFCTAGITHIKSSNGLSVPLYSSARTSPAINVKVNDSVCYGSLATGQSSGALNVRVGSTTYHSIN